MTAARVVVAAALFVLAGCDAAERPGPSALTARDALITAPLGDGPAAMYVTLSNAGPRPDTLVAVATEAAARTELHRVVNDGQLVQMEMVDLIEVPARGEVRLAPGGYHVMLLDPRAGLSPGETVEVDLVYSRAGAITIPAVVGTHTDAARMMDGPASEDPRGGR